MRRILLSTLFMLVSGILFTAIAQQTITLKIIQTHLDGETAISYDDGEFENDSIDKVNDDDLDMGWEGEDLNIMTTYTRFQNVMIPKGSTIHSAVLHIFAHEDEADEARVSIYAEDADNSPMFSETEALEDRTWTEASVRWVISEPWTMWQAYDSPDLSIVIQEVINRSGWMAGNSLTLFLTGEDQGASLLDNARDFESFENIEDPDDGGDGLHHPERIPMLEIQYTPPAGELVLTIIETDKDGETSISFDDGEYENDSIDKVNDDDLDMGWEGEDLNIMTTYTRFQNVTIPQGAQIDSAVLVIYAHEDESAEAFITVYAENVDDSPRFTEDEALSDREMTSAKVEWDITEDWTMWEQYHSPNLAPVIQAVIDRAGWQSGNSLTLFLMGEDQGASLLDNARDFESFENIEDPDDGGDGLHHPERIPTLKIYYSLAASSREEIRMAHASSVDIFPNPADNGTLHIISTGLESLDVEIYSLTGRLVKTLRGGSQNLTIDVSDLGEGLYLIKTIQGNESETHKVIIQ
ncbi:MAG: T9SS type A sorting domain-containing protein [Bacteroidales bacterium]